MCIYTYIYIYGHPGITGPLSFSIMLVSEWLVVTCTNYTASTAVSCDIFVLHAWH